MKLSPTRCRRFDNIIINAGVRPKIKIGRLRYFCAYRNILFVTKKVPELCSYTFQQNKSPAFIYPWENQWLPNEEIKF